MKKNNQKGFSLIELLLVLTIAGILATIAIPNLASSRRSANEASALASIRVINAAQTTYQGTLGQGGFGSFPSLFSQRLIDQGLGLAPNTRNGYLFTLAVVPKTLTTPSVYDLTCTPQYSAGVFASTARRNFYSNETHRLYYSTLPAVPPSADPNREIIGGFPVNY